MSDPITAPKAEARTPESSVAERLAFLGVPLWVVALIALIGLVVVALLGSALLDPRRDDGVARTARAIAELPGTIRNAFAEILPNRPTIREGYPQVAGGLWRNPNNEFIDPGHVLLTGYDPAQARRVIRLIRLSDGVELKRWTPGVSAIHARSSYRTPLIDLTRDKTPRRYFPMHPMLTPDGGLLLHDSSPLVKVDACGRAQWMVDGIFHHALERDGDGNLWASYRLPRPAQPGVSSTFKEEAIVALAPDGKQIHYASIIGILDRNGLGQKWRARPYDDDPFHLNDVEPVLNDGPYWKRGDVFLSLRNLSLVALYRPATGKILWHRNLPWRFQHDVNVIDDHRISIFDNNWKFDWRAPEQGVVDGTNRVMIYDFSTDRITEPFEPGLSRLDVRTVAQGRATPLPGGDMMVEETEMGRLLRLAPGGQVLWRYVEADAAMRRYELRWSRYLNTATDQAGIAVAIAARCD